MNNHYAHGIPLESELIIQNSYKNYSLNIKLNEY